MVKEFMTALLVFAATVGVIGIMGTSQVLAKGKPAETPTPANNGTLKVHEYGSPIATAPEPGTENNQPKVCVFNFEGFFFDANQEGYLEVVTQGGGPTPTLVAGPIAVVSDSDGYYATGQYFNDEDGPTITNGLYKVTWYIKDLPQGEDRDEKAKSKVFNVDCVRASAPTFMDRCGTENDVFTIPESSGITYKVNNVITSAGTYPGSGMVTITASATKGTIAGASSWSHTFTNEACGEAIEAIISAELFCDATTRMFTLKVSNSGTDSADVSVNGKTETIAKSASVNFEIGVDSGAGVKVDMLVDNEYLPEAETKGFDGSRTFFAAQNCKGGGGSNGTPVETIGGGSGAVVGDVTSLPVTSGAGDKAAALVVMIGSILATSGGYALRARSGELSI